MSVMEKNKEEESQGSLNQEILEKPSARDLPEGLEAFLDYGEDCLVLIFSPQKETLNCLLLTSTRVIFFRQAKYGKEFKECRLKKRPVSDCFEEEENEWTITVSCADRVLQMPNVSQETSSLFCKTFDELMDSLGLTSNPWDELDSNEALWSEMHHYLEDTGEDPLDNDSEGTGREEAEEAAEDDFQEVEMNDLQKSWIEKGAKPRGHSPWPSSASTLVWIIPILLVLWIAHTIFIASASETSQVTKTSALLHLAKNGDPWALNQLAYRLPKEKDPNTKIGIARMIARQNLPGAAEMLFQDIFSHDSYPVRHAEIKALLEMNLGKELVARLVQPGNEELKKTLISDLALWGDSSVAKELERYYPRASAGLKPSLQRALAKLGRSSFLVSLYQRGDEELKKSCLRAIRTLDEESKKVFLEELLKVVSKPSRRNEIKGMLMRE